MAMPIIPPPYIMLQLVNNHDICTVCSKTGYNKGIVTSRSVKIVSGWLVHDLKEFHAQCCITFRFSTQERPIIIVVHVVNM